MKMGIYRKILKHIAPLFLAAGISSSASSACSDDGSLFPAPCSYRSTIEEICNNKDDNCDGNTDESCDDDGDGYCAKGKRFEPIDFTQEHPYWMEEDFTCKESFQACREVFTEMQQSQLLSPHCLPLLDCDDTSADDRGYCRALTALEDCLLPEYSTCAACIHPSAQELCDLVDNDCNGYRDEYFPEEGLFCYSDKDRNIHDAREVTSTEGRCGPFSYLCISGMLRCGNQHYGQEVCDNEDNDCDGVVDNNEAQNERRDCYYQWQQDSTGAWRKIDGLDNPEHYGYPDVGICKKGSERCTTDCYDPQIAEPVRLEESECREDLPAGTDGACCKEGVIGGNQICYDSQFALPEICNCLDDNCNGEADEGLHSEYHLDFAVVTDCSGSMVEELGTVRNAFTGLHFPECFATESIRISSIYVGDPISFQPLLFRTLVAGDVFGASFGPDLDSIPATSCASEELTLHAAAYLACATPEAEDNITCRLLQEERMTPFDSTFNVSVMDYFFIGKAEFSALLSSLPEGFSAWEQEERDDYLYSYRREIWREGSERHLIFIADEKAQSEYSYLNQQVVGDLLREAGIWSDLYILKANHYNFFTEDGSLIDPSGDAFIAREEGYGYFVCQDYQINDDGSYNCINRSGNVYDLDEEIAAGRLGRSIRQLFIDYYCGGDGAVESIEEESSSKEKKW